MKAMTIKDGDNFSEASAVHTAQLTLAGLWSGKAKLLASQVKDGLVYQLIKYCRCPTLVLQDIEGGKLAAVAYTEVSEYKSGYLELNAIRIHPSFQKKGFGQACVNLLRIHSPKGITSSFDMGTYGLALWCSLARKHEDVKILIRENKDWVVVPRKDVDIETSMLQYKGKPINEQSADVFFVWPK